ncbi:MAG: hypothetical protein IPJ21_20190 [Sterolibacteriaceae bacterium]|nr:hypothetical protein [Sterolibacteriaceae bacterium]
MPQLTTLVSILLVGIVVGIVADESLTLLFRTVYAVHPPTRPPNIPASARWEGGSDGGNWFECVKEADAKYRCSVFADVTGALIVSDLYTVVPESSNGDLRPVLLRSDTEIELMGARLVRPTKAK